MKNYINTITIFIALISFSFLGCDKGFEEINTNPNQSVDDPSLDLLFGAVLPGFIGQPLGSYEVPGQLAQQFALKNSDVGTLTHDEDAVSRRFWEIAYSENNGALRNASFLIFEAERQGNLVYQAIGKIYKVYMLSYTTDLFGDIPYIDAGQGYLFENEAVQPAYDAQQNVYATMIADLDAANDLLASALGNQTIDDSRDMLFQGDILKWRKFANTLQLRLLMRISGVEDTAAKISSIFGNTATYPLMESIEDEPAFSANTIEGWPFQPDREDVVDRRLSATMVDIMKGEGGVNKIADQQDPRLSYLLNPTENSVLTGTPEFVGQPIGIASDTDENDDRSLLSDDFRNLNKFWLITYAELLYIKSEAAQRGFISGDASDFLTQGITASLNRYGIDSVSPESQGYLASVASNFAGDEIKYIAIQRWIDQVNNGFEGYSVWRRTGFPVLELGQDAIAPQIPTRYFYSSKTTDKNQANADIAIARAPLNGSNTTFQKVWWDND